MVIHLTGPDTFRSHRRLQQLRQVWREKFDPHGFNTVTLDGATVTAEELRTAVQTTGLFSPQRFVAVDDYVAGTAACAPSALAEAVMLVLKNKETVVVIRAIASPTKKKYAGKKSSSKTKSGAVKKTVAKQELSLPEAKVEEFPLLTSFQLTDWVLAEAKTRGGKIGRESVEQLVALCQNDLWRINSELDKLIAYTFGREITSVDVEAMVRSPYTSDIFGLLDAIGQRRQATAVRLLHNELESGTHPLALISTVANHVRTLLMVGGASDKDSASTLATNLGLHPFVVQKALIQTKLFAPQTLRDWHHQLITIDFQLKSTVLDAETLLDVLLLKETAAV